MEIPKRPSGDHTERANDLFRGIDTWDSRRILEALLDDQRAAVGAVEAALAQIDAAAEATVPRLEAGGRLICAGAGTSGRIAVQDGVELIPTFGWPADRIAFLLAGGEAALTRSIEGAEDDDQAGADAVDAVGAAANDVVLGLAASGTTPYTVGVIARARERGALTIGVANNPDTPVLTAAECPVLLDTGPEAIAGSTRMKAGTAQKIMMNLFSSLVMIRMGRVYDGYMIDLKATNRKLARRSARILVELTGCDAAAARDALARCDGRLKQALLVLHGLSPQDAAASLAEAKDNVRRSLSRLVQGSSP